jgi:hypothetical protein
MAKRTRDSLLVFDNVDVLPSARMRDKFELALRHLLTNQPKIKVMITSSEPMIFSNIEAK